MFLAPFVIPVFAIIALGLACSKYTRRTSLLSVAICVVIATLLAVVGWDFDEWTLMLVPIVLGVSLIGLVSIVGSAVHEATTKHKAESEAKVQENSSNLPPATHAR